MKKSMLSARRFLTVAALAITTTLACQTSNAEILIFRASLDNQQERFGGTDQHPARGTARLIINTDTQMYRLDMNVKGIFIRDFLNRSKKIPERQAFIDPAAPNYTPIHLHIAPPGQNGPVVVEAATAPSLTLDRGVIPAADSNPNPNRTLPITGIRPGGDSKPRSTRSGFKLNARGRIPDGQVQPVNGAEPFGPYVHDFDFNDMVNEALEGRMYVNVHSSFFEGRDTLGNRILRGQSLPNALIRGQFELIRRYGH